MIVQFYQLRKSLLLSLPRTPPLQMDRELTHQTHPTPDPMYLERPAIPLGKSSSRTSRVGFRSQPLRCHASKSGWKSGLCSFGTRRLISRVSDAPAEVVDSGFQQHFTELQPRTTNSSTTSSNTTARERSSSSMRSTNWKTRASFTTSTACDSSGSSASRTRRRNCSAASTTGS